MSTERKIAHSGTKFTIAFARDCTGACPAEVFFDALPISDKAKVATLFKMLGDGQTSNPHKFGDLKNGLYELKSFQIRIPFAYASSPRERGMVLLTHGFLKKKDKTPPAEIDRAKRILKEDENLSKICNINDSKKRKRHEYET